MRVLVVGGGVAGLALAAELARQGHEPLVPELPPPTASTASASHWMPTAF